MAINFPNFRSNISRTSDGNTATETAAPIAQGAAGTPANAAASPAAQNTPQTSARRDNTIRTLLTRAFPTRPHHAEWQAWAKSDDQEFGENRAEAVKRMKACLSKSNRRNEELTLNLEGLGLTSLPETLPAGIKMLFINDNRLIRLPRNLPDSLESVALYNNRFELTRALPDHVIPIHPSQSVEELDEPPSLFELRLPTEPDDISILTSSTWEGASNTSYVAPQHLTRDEEEELDSLLAGLDEQSTLTSSTAQGASKYVAAQHLTRDEEEELDSLLAGLDEPDEQSTPTSSTAQGASNTKLS